MEFQKDGEGFKMKSLFKIIGWPTYQVTRIDRKIQNIQSNMIGILTALIVSMFWMFGLPLAIEYFFHVEIILHWFIFFYFSVVCYEKGYNEQD